MDRSYNPFGSSQAPVAPAGGVSGGVISSGTVGTGGVGAGGVGVPMGSGVISSGTGDVVLAPSGSGKSKKPWIIAGIVAAVVAVASAVAAVVVMNSGPKKTAEEEYADIYDVISEYAFDVYDVNEIVSDGLGGWLKFGELYGTCSAGNIGDLRDRMNDFNIKIQKASYDGLSSNLKDVAKKLVEEQAPDYFELIDEILGRIDDLCNAMVDGGEEGINEFMVSVGADNNVGEGVVSGVNLIQLMTRYANECGKDGGSDVCRDLLVQADGYENAMKDATIAKMIFEKIVDIEQMKQMNDFQGNMNAIMNVANDLSQNSVNEDNVGGGNE